MVQVNEEKANGFQGAEMRPARKLSACPFCGSSVIGICRSHDTRTSFYYASCNNCEAEGPTDYSQDGAVMLWNRRREEGEQ